MEAPDWRSAAGRGPGLRRARDAWHCLPSPSTLATSSSRNSSSVEPPPADDGFGMKSAAPSRSASRAIAPPFVVTGGVAGLLVRYVLLLEAFLRTDDPREDWKRLLCFLSPITIAEGLAVEVPR